VETSAGHFVDLSSPQISAIDRLSVAPNIHSEY
jgi:hypothetical protein